MDILIISLTLAIGILFGRAWGARDRAHLMKMNAIAAKVLDDRDAETERHTRLEELLDQLEALVEPEKERGDPEIAGSSASPVDDPLEAMRKLYSADDWQVIVDRLGIEEVKRRAARWPIGKGAE